VKTHILAILTEELLLLWPNGKKKELQLCMMNQILAEKKVQVLAPIM
jgi:hypothetical protein